MLMVLIHLSPSSGGFFFIDKKKSLLKIVQELSGYDYAVNILHRSDDGT